LLRHKMSYLAVNHESFLHHLKRSMVLTVLPVKVCTIDLLDL
jgi:hypothetical protein